MVYDYKKDVADWEAKHGRVVFVGDSKMIPQLPKWLTGDKKE